MRPIGAKKQILVTTLRREGPFSGRPRTPFFSRPQNLGLMLEGNQVLKAYSRNGNTAINNFLRGSSSTALAYNPDEIEFLPPQMRYISEKMRKEELQRIREGKIVVYDVNYPPMTKAFVKSIIDIDTALRLSKSLNKQPTRLYRGTVPVGVIDMNMLNSWSTDMEIARHFASSEGSFLTTDLPAGFPYIFMNDTKASDFTNELEYIIPPCEFEVTKSAPDTMSFTENAEVTLRPHNLAKLLLLRMKNPPADYPRTYIRDPYYEFEESLKMLENYVKNYVDKGYIKFGNRIFKEAKSQDFESPLDKE